jgi:nucleotide-binding universal stress UspA family protein
MTQTIKRILVPIDDSPGTQVAIDYAVLLARALGASLTLVHVDEVPPAITAIVPGASVEGDLAAEQVASKMRMAEMVSALRGRDFDNVETIMLTAAAVAPALLDTSRSGRFDLIVMGTHARTGVSRLLLGSIAEEVLRHATCPVLTVHLPPE